MSKLPDNVVLRVEPIPDNVNQTSCAGCYFYNTDDCLMPACTSPKSTLIGFNGRFIWFVEVKDDNQKS
ncbi:MAG: hypothetical protein RL755_24 [Pseudomonadota bacterium]|jgi:hypothetical protein